MDASRRLRILLLEDQGLVRAGMKALIQISEPHAAIREASSYEEAVEAVRNGTFDIAFLDIDLKGQLSGLDFLRYIRSLDVDTRAIMLSGRLEKEIVMTCIEAGASGYILKDMESEGLFRRALDTVFQGNIFLPASVIGRGGFSPAPAVAPASLSVELIGVTGRALEVLYYLCQGLPNKAIANRMGSRKRPCARITYRSCSGSSGSHAERSCWWKSLDADYRFPRRQFLCRFRRHLWLRPAACGNSGKQRLRRDGLG